MRRFATLLDGPSPAVLTTYRKNGTAVPSPVWFRHADGGLEVVIAEDDVKLRHLAAHPDCTLLVFEAVPPFRAVRVEGVPSLRTEGVAEVRRAVADRYLGADLGARFTASRGPGVVLRLPLDGARSWDLDPIVPTATP